MRKQLMGIRPVALLVCGLIFSLTAHAVDLSGDWQAELEVQKGISIPVVIHIQDEQGKQTGTLDSPSQGTFGVPLSKLKFDDQELVFEIAQFNVHYNGRFDAKSGTIRGKYIQGRPLDAVFSRVEKSTLATSNSSDPGVIADTWSGILRYGGGELTVVYHIRNDNGKLTATHDTPDQGGFDFEVDVVKFKEGRVELIIKQLGSVYVGMLSEDESEIHGTFYQRGAQVDIKMTRSGEKRKLSARPQTPQPPFTYSEEEVTIQNGPAITLAGTLTRPENHLPRAIAVLITGSGAQDRDSTILRHKPFLVIADDLTTNGFAVLRLDDRGVGGSTGDPATATSMDFASDISAAVDYLMTRDDLRSDDGAHKIGLIGHSEGGMIGPIVASQRDDLSFLVMLAGPGTTGSEVLAEQNYLVSQSQGADDDFLDDQLKLHTRLFQHIVSIPLDKPLDETAESLFRQSLVAAGVTSEQEQETQLQMQLNLFSTPWFRFFLSYDPAEYLSRVRIPVLALNGSVDLQIAALSNLGGIRSILERAGHRDFQITELDNLNHLFQTSDTGSVGEYGELTETFSPKALTAIKSWLDKRF